MSSINSSGPISSEKSLLAQTRWLLSFTKDKLCEKKGNHSNGGWHEEEFQLRMSQIWNGEKLAKLERILNERMKQRELNLEDSLLNEICGVLERVSVWMEKSAIQTEELRESREECATLRKDQARLEQTIAHFDERVAGEKTEQLERIRIMEEKYSKEGDQLNKQVERFVEERHLMQKTLDAQIVEIIQLREKVDCLSVFSSSLQKSLDERNIEMDKLKAIHQGEVSAHIYERTLKGIMTAKSTKHTILAFLPLNDVFKMRLLNREYNLIITRDFHLERIIITHLNRLHINQQQALRKRADYFMNLSQSLPDEVVKVAILKFLCQKHRVGDIILPSINLSQNFIDAIITGSSSKQLQTENHQTMSASTSITAMTTETTTTASSEENNTAEKVNLISDNNSIASTDITKNTKLPIKESAAKKTFSFMKKLLGNKNTIQSAAQNDFIPPIISGQSALHEEQANHLLSDMNASIRIDKRSMDLFVEEAGISHKYLELERDETRKKIQSLSEKCLGDAKKLTWFIENLENRFCDLFVFSKYLFQEAKSLYDLQAYLSYELIQNKQILQNQQNKLEDVTASRDALDRMKDYLALKLKETEKKNLKNDTIFLKNNKLIQELRDDNASLSLKILSLEKSKQKSDHNLKILAKEVRNQLKKNIDTSAKYEKLLNNMNYLKDALAHFKILEE